MGEIRARGRPARGAWVLALVLAVAATLPACAAGGPGPDPGADSEAVALAELDRVTNTRNDADTAFVRQMIPHHEQGVELADLVAARTDTLAVRDLAGRISRAQGVETGQLRGFLTAWREDPATGTAGMTGMAGMVGPGEMAGIRAARGPAFDRLWLRAMIAHHEGAVAMAGTELRDGVNRGARNTASNTVAVQQREIATMRGLLVR